MESPDINKYDQIMETTISDLYNRIGYNGIIYLLRKYSKINGQVLYSMIMMDYIQIYEYENETLGDFIKYILPDLVLQFYDENLIEY